MSKQKANFCLWVLHLIGHAFQCSISNFKCSIVHIVSTPVYQSLCHAAKGYFLVVRHPHTLSSTPRCVEPVGNQTNVTMCTRVIFPSQLMQSNGWAASPSPRVNSRRVGSGSERRVSKMAGRRQSKTDQESPKYSLCTQNGRERIQKGRKAHRPREMKERDDGEKR